MKIITSSGIEFSALPLDAQPDFIHGDYRTLYEVKVHGTDAVRFYVGNGWHDGNRRVSEVYVFFPNGQMWSSYGKTIKEAIEGAMADGWIYATNKSTSANP